MIAAQLLAYYFTELKDDQVKKVSPSLRGLPKCPSPTLGPGGERKRKKERQLTLHSLPKNRTALWLQSSQAPM